MRRFPPPLIMHKHEFLLLKNEEPLIVQDIRGDEAIFGNGYSSLKKQPLNEFANENGELSFVLVQRNHQTAKDNFNWSWIGSTLVVDF